MTSAYVRFPRKMLHKRSVRFRPIPAMSGSAAFDPLRTLVDTHAFLERCRSRTGPDEAVCDHRLRRTYSHNATTNEKGGSEEPPLVTRAGGMACTGLTASVVFRFLQTCGKRQSAARVDCLFPILGPVRQPGGSKPPQ